MASPLSSDSILTKHRKKRETCAKGQSDSKLRWRIMHSRVNVSTLVIFAILFAAAMAFGQAVTGTILGRVTDASGAVVPGAMVQLQNVDTGLSRTETTDSGGRYLSRNLP